MLAVPCARAFGGVVVFPHNCARGKNYTCPECTKSVILKRGAVKTPHFAHKGSHSCTGESLVHMSTKEYIASAVPSPDFTIVAGCTVRCLTCTQFRGGPMYTAKTEVTIGSYRVDVAVYRKGRLYAAIEVCHTHACSAEKLRVLSTVLYGGVYEIPAIHLVVEKFPMQMETTRPGACCVRYCCALCRQKKLDNRWCEERTKRRRCALHVGQKWLAKALATKKRRAVHFGRRWLLLHRARRCGRLTKKTFDAEEKERLKPCDGCNHSIVMYTWGKTFKGHNIKQWCPVADEPGHPDSRVVNHDNKWYHTKCSPVCPECFESNQNGTWCDCKKTVMRPCQDCGHWFDKDTELFKFTVPRVERQDQNGWVCKGCVHTCLECDGKISNKQRKFGGKCYTCNRKRKLDELQVSDSGCVDCGKITGYKRCFSCHRR